ncbi:hypothetical protein PUN28_010892 [Cardiocondyla obscurior]|uniref:Uncharacterized protein n=1 Tax=Cardiocondyla obscurior TaxID=286306 RepID=A0AAW2FKG6_9HYME
MLLLNFYILYCCILTVLAKVLNFIYILFTICTVVFEVRLNCAHRRLYKNQNEASYSHR